MTTRATEFVRKIGPGSARRPRTGAKRTVTDIVRQLPAYLKLLFGLFTDPRVAVLDKVLVGAEIAYIISPLDFIPDYIPFLGEVDDVYLLATSLTRLTANAGRRVLLDHWIGDPKQLTLSNIRRAASAAAFFLPRLTRRRLRRVGRH